MQTPFSPEPKVAASSPAPDKSRFKFQKLLQPFTVDRAVVTPIIWFLASFE